MVESGYFQNMEQLMKHLLNGGAITNLDDSCRECWVALYNGNLIYSDGTKKEEISHPHSWRPVPMSWLVRSIIERRRVKYV